MKIARIKGNLTQRQLAEKTGIHRTIISGIECRKIVGNEKHRAAILEVIGGKEADFFESSGLAR